VKKKMTAQRFDRAASTHNANAVPALPPSSTNGKLIASSTKPGKRPKKIKREKVRFGQAPRNSLMPGDAVVEASPSAQGPGAAATLQQDAPQVADTSTDVNPLLPQATAEKKTRFAKSEPVHGPKKPKKLNAKQKEKLSATPIPLTADEKKQQQVQAEALGVNGDNLSKKKKVKQKKVKGQKKAPEPAKPRIQERPAPTGPVQPAPTVNPNLGAPIPGQVPATSGASSSTTTPASK
jgi:peptidyl-prolyl cis-trans isomerase SurA